MAAAPDAEERALRDIAHQLSLAYPGASYEHIEAILRANYAASRDAKVQTYRLLLAERDTRVRLRREAPPPSTIPRPRP